MVDLKATIKDQIDQADERLLKLINALIIQYNTEDEGQLVSFDTNGNGLTRSQLLSVLNSEVEGAKNGTSISFDEFKRKTASWV